MARNFKTVGTSVNKETDSRRQDLNRNATLSPEQRQIYEGAMAKKLKNDAASKERTEAKGKYVRRAAKTLAARQRAYASMASDVQRTMRAPGSMKTTI